MPAPKKYNRTVQPRTAAGDKALPGILPDGLVGPLSIRYADDEANEEIATVSEFVMEQLRSLGRSRLGYDQLLTIVKEVLEETYGKDKPAVVRSLLVPVISYLTDSQQVRQVSGGKNARNRRNSVYEFGAVADGQSAESEAPVPALVLTKDQMLERLVARLEEVTGRNSALEKELAKARKSAIDPEQLAQLVAKLEAANTEIRSLNDRLAQAAATRERLAREYNESLRAKEQQVAGLHASLNMMRGELDKAKALITKLRAELRAAKQQGADTVDPALKARLDKLLES